MGHRIERPLIELIIKLGGLESACNSGFNSWVGKIVWRREWQPTLVFLPGESHGAWWVIVHGTAKSWTWLSDFHYTTLIELKGSKNSHWSEEEYDTVKPRGGECWGATGTCGPTLRVMSQLVHQGAWWPCRSWTCPAERALWGDVVQLPLSSSSPSCPILNTQLHFLDEESKI